MVEHVNITDPDVHEPKGASTASANQVYIANGSGSGVWTLHRDTGWGNYNDLSSGSQVFNTTASKLQIDGGGSESSSSYLPRSIRGSSELWDTTNDKITPIAVGDAYTVRLNLSIASKTGSPNYLNLELDIGGLTSPSNVILVKPLSTLSSTPYEMSNTFSIYTLSTFLANGGQIFLSTDTGTVTVDDASVLITRTHYE